jgi:hypothetical protein
MEATRLHTFIWPYPDMFLVFEVRFQLERSLDNECWLLNVESFPKGSLGWGFCLPEFTLAALCALMID